MALKRQHKKGFSILEIMVVLVLLGLIISIVAPRVQDALLGGQQKAVKIQIKQIEGYLDRYNIDCSAYPTTAEGLEALVKKPASCPSWNPKGYTPNKKVPVDPWNMKFQYRSDDGVDYEIISYGKDKKEGGEGDNKDFSSKDEEGTPESEGESE
jgi:general secretion pathway protein G